MTKKAIAILLTLALVIALPVAALGNPGQNPNRNPGSPQVQVATITITVTGGGNNLVIRAINADGDVKIIPRLGNGTWTQAGAAFGYTFTIRVQGNSLREVTITGFPAAPAPTVVEEYSFYRFVRLNQVESLFTGTEEISREFVNGAAVKHNWVRGNQNDFPGLGFTGQAVQTGARVTGTLNFEYVRNYVEQFERVYEWVDVTVWSNGDRDEVVRVDSEHVRGGLEDGDAFYTGPFAGSSDIDVSGGSVVLHMGYQGGVHGRYATIAVGGFTVSLTLHDTGNPPTISATIAGYVLSDL